MWTVGIETSGREGGVALLQDDELVTQRPLSAEGRRHARTLVHELQQMLADAGVSPRACDVIAVSRGPGSFTGLRVGIVCAKTWAFAAGCRVAGVDTFLAVAGSAPSDVSEIDVISDAQRGDLYHGRYERGEDGLWMRQSDVRIVSADEWLDSVRQPCVVTGPAVCKLRDRLTGEAHLLPEEAWFPQAVEVARIGRRRAAAGRTDDLWALEPLYLRKSAAEEKADA